MQSFPILLVEFDGVHAFLSACINAVCTKRSIFVGSSSFCSLQVAVGWLPIWPLLVEESSCRLVGAVARRKRGGGDKKSSCGLSYLTPSLPLPPSIPQRVRLVDPGCVPEREGRGNRIGRHRRCRPPLMSRLKRDTDTIQLWALVCDSAIGLGGSE